MVDRQFVSRNGMGISLTVSPSGQTHVQTNPSDAVPEVTKDKEKNETKGKFIQFTDNMSTLNRVIICASEFLGTAILLFLGCMGCVNGVAGGIIPHEQISFTFGLAVMVSIQCFGHISGAHINPAVTVASATLGYIPLIQVPIFFTGQFLGALAGFGLLKAVTPSEMIKATGSSAPGVCSPGISTHITVYQGLLVEFTATLILVLVCCAVWDSRNSTKHDSVSIRFGLAVAVLAMAAGPYTGANMNPVRSFAPALINGDWKHHWVYWIGPLFAGLFGGLLYRLVFQKPETPSPEEHETYPLNDKA